jgi:hypothetical protein
MKEDLGRPLGTARREASNETRPPPAALALLTALVTVSFQTIRAAVTDPVDSLRYE